MVGVRLAAAAAASVVVAVVAAYAESLEPSADGVVDFLGSEEASVQVQRASWWWSLWWWISVRHQ